MIKTSVKPIVTATTIIRAIMAIKAILATNNLPVITIIQIDHHVITATTKVIIVALCQICSAMA